MYKSLAVVVLLMWSVTALAQSELWKCRKADGTVLFSDRGGPGCRKIDAEKDLPPVKQFPSPGGVSPSGELSPLPPPAPAAPAASVPKTTPSKALSSMPFPPTTRAVVSLAVVHHVDEEEKARGKAYHPELGDYTFVELQVSHLPEGNGPKVEADSHFGAEGRAALPNAVAAAARATGYDPRFLKVGLALPTSYMNRGANLDGPSAGIAWAVAVASAILGDTLRPDVCMTGTINASLMVGPIGGLDKKIDGCHNIQGKEIIFPVGQQTFNVYDRGQARAIKLTEVATFAEAYQAATGQALRPK